MTISKAQRERVQVRAKNRCEYCHSHQNFILGWLEVDHWLPIAKGGKDTDDNLCLACEFCNQYKWTQIEGVDPQSGQTVPLFHPRRQIWEEHFSWSEDGTRILGLTPCGWATVIALRLNNELAVTVRRNWVRAGWHPPGK